MKVFVYVRFAVRRGENLLPSFLNAVLCEFNVQKRCQTSNPEEENCLFSSKLSSWTPFICNEVLQAQPSTSGWGEKSSAHKAAQMGAWEGTSPRKPGTPPYFSFSPNLERTSTCRMLRCLITLIKLFAKAQEFVFPLWLPCGHHLFLLSLTAVGMISRKPQRSGNFPPSSETPGPAAEGHFLTWACQLLRSTPETGVWGEVCSTASPGDSQGAPGLCPELQLAVTCQEPDHSQKL